SQRLRLGSGRIAPGRSQTFTDSIRVSRPRLWTPRRPSLYSTSFSVSAGGRSVAGYRARSGIRSVKVVNGKLTLNGLPVNIRGVGMHEDDRAVGFALTPEMREALVKDAQDMGATMLRSHYPLHPHFHEMADERGLLVWSEIPMYGMKTEKIKNLVVRKVARAAGLELSAHVLRHTCITKLVRRGSDVVLVAELAGHRRLETTRRYSLPSDADRQLAMDDLEVED
ncbi:MAG: tyrosine-type recombinase/integrase, partial [Actinobacteria bacterium]|nr:tyrosine-type recombinase/integrase [Actinomycetota bacterium]